MPYNPQNSILCAVTGNPGTGTVTVGSAISGYQTPASAGVNDQDVVDICIVTVDANGIPTGLFENQKNSTYTAAGTSFSRSAGNVTAGSSGAGTLVNFSSGTQ